MNKKNDTITKTVKTGISFGSALAMVISYVFWKCVSNGYQLCKLAFSWLGNCSWINELGVCHLLYN